MQSSNAFDRWRRKAGRLVILLLIAALLAAGGMQPGAALAGVNVALAQGGTTTADIPLAPGWNLVSLPLRPIVSSLEILLAPIAGQVAEVWTYDAGDSADPWATYLPGSPSNDLQAVNERMGLWVRSLAATTWTISGTAPAQTNIALIAGWNLVGYPGAAAPIQEALAGVLSSLRTVRSYDAANQSWRRYVPGAPVYAQSLTQLEPGRAYWIDMSQNVTWTITTQTGPAWLVWLNSYRRMAGLPALTEDATWSDGCWKHARYMVKNDYIGHSEVVGNAWYTAEGALAAQYSNVMVSANVAASDEYAINLWMEGPFHAVGILDPTLLQTGFGSYRESIGTWRMGAALDVLRGRGALPPTVTFPVVWPGEGAIVGLSSYGGSENPSPLTSCAGYSAPTGLPLVVQLGTGGVTPAVTAHSFSGGGTPLEHCVFSETTYANPNASSQSLGRAILDDRDAIVLIPRAPLTPGVTYAASITANGQTIRWSFTVASQVSSNSASEAERVE